MQLGTFIIVTTKSDQFFRTYDYEEPRIDAHVSDHITSGGTRDSIISLRCLDDAELRILASEIASWAISTPESRRRNIELSQADSVEEKEFRHSTGDWET